MYLIIASPTANISILSLLHYLLLLQPLTSSPIAGTHSSVVLRTSLVIRRDAATHTLSKSALIIPLHLVDTVPCRCIEPPYLPLNHVNAPRLRMYLTLYSTVPILLSSTVTLQALPPRLASSSVPFRPT